MRHVHYSHNTCILCYIYSLINISMIFLILHPSHFKIICWSEGRKFNEIIWFTVWIIHGSPYYQVLILNLYTFPTCISLSLQSTWYIDCYLHDKVNNIQYNFVNLKWSKHEPGKNVCVLAVAPALLLLFQPLVSPSKKHHGYDVTQHINMVYQ